MNTRRTIWGMLTLASLFLLQPAHAHYNPAHGRWLNRDPLGESQGPALYGFVGNEPISRIDTDGRESNNAPPMRLDGPGKPVYPSWDYTPSWDPAPIRSPVAHARFGAVLGIAGSTCSVILGGTLALSPEPSTLTKIAGGYMVGVGVEGLYSMFTGQPGLREKGLNAVGVPASLTTLTLTIADVAICGKCCPTPIPGVPRGFGSSEQFRKAVSELENALKAGGIGDASIGVRGSAVSGFSFRTGKPFGPRSDLDFFVESGDLTQGMRTSRNIPGFVYPWQVSKRCESVSDWTRAWSEELGRKVTVGAFQPGTVPVGPVLRP